MDDEKTGFGSDIFVGQKEVEKYVFAVLALVRQDVPLIKVKARGKLISKAVDVALISQRYVKDMVVDDVVIDSERIVTDEGGSRDVSSIEVVLRWN